MKRSKRIRVQRKRSVRKNGTETGISCARLDRLCEFDIIVVVVVLDLFDDVVSVVEWGSGEG